MIFTNGEKCPVCDKVFTEDDDIVICPRCGTPHHRECYNELGHCANLSKHAESFEYGASATENSQTVNDYDDSAVQNEAVICPHCGEANDSSTAFCKGCGERLDTNRFTAPAGSINTIGIPYNQFDESDETIDGKSVADISTVVGSNAQRFIEYFKSGKKRFWSWGAFFFSGYYFVFRKMYKEGAIVIAIKFAISLVAQGVYAKQLASFSTILESVYKIFQSNEIAQLTDELATSFINAYQQLLPMYIIILASSLIISIVCALYADSIYKKKVFSILDKVESNLESGGSFGVNPMFAEQTQLTQEQMRKIYLSKLGGISVFAPFLAYTALNILSRIVSNM